MKRLPISICMMAGNEARRIRQALASVADWASEIIVVTDPKVNDGTDQIAASYGAKVFCQPWEGAGKHRNFASLKATQPWLMALDADEVVSPALRDEILRVIGAVTAKADCRYAAYSFPRCTFFLGRWIRHGDWYPDRIVRIWQRERGHWEGVVHERLEVDGPVGRLHSDLLHYTAETIDRQIAKALNYSNTFAEGAISRQRRVGSFDLLIRPAWRFVRTYFLRLGFLDGWQGCYIAWMSAFFAITRYAKVSEARSGQSQK